VVARGLAFGLPIRGRAGHTAGSREPGEYTRGVHGLGSCGSGGEGVAERPRQVVRALGMPSPLAVPVAGDGSDDGTGRRLEPVNDGGRPVLAANSSDLRTKPPGSSGVLV
jgi:hypothetical protein